MTALNRIKKFGLAIAALAVTAAPQAWAFDIEITLGDADPMIDMPIYTEPPVFEVETYPVFNPRLIDIWKAAINRPEADTRRRVAKAIVKADQDGMEGLREAFIPRMTSELEKPGQHRLVLLSMAEALVALDAKQSAPQLLAQSDKDGLEMARITDAALARWDYKPAREVWLKRLADEDAPHALRIISAESLSKVGAQEAVKPLTDLLLDRREAVQLRLAAAHAIGRLAPANTNELAGRVQQGGSMIGKLAAVALLSHADSDQAVQRLLGLTEPSNEGVVIAAAMARLLEIDPLLLKDRAAQLATNSDSSVRGFAVEALTADPRPASVEALQARLTDPIPVIRQASRDALIKFGQDESLKQPVVEAGTKVLQGDDWRGQEQAALLLGKLDHEPAFDRLLELTTVDRLEVAVASAAAIRWLAIESKLPQVLEAAKRNQEQTLALLRGIESLPPKPEEPQNNRRRNNQVEEEPEDPLYDLHFQAYQRSKHNLVASQFFQLFGRLNYTEAEPLLMIYVPKKVTDVVRYGTEARVAAIWALGHFHEGEPDSGLVKQLTGRMTDNNIMDPEVELVRRAAALSLAKMNARGAADAMRGVYNVEGLQSTAGAGAIQAWSLLTGNPMPETGPIPFEELNWFLAPDKRMDI